MWSVKRCEIVGRREDPVTGLWSGGRGVQWPKWPGQDPSCCRRWQFVNSGLTMIVHSSKICALNWPMLRCSSDAAKHTEILSFIMDLSNRCALKWPLYLMLPCLLLNMTVSHVLMGILVFICSTEMFKNTYVGWHFNTFVMQPFYTFSISVYVIFVN